MITTNKIKRIVIVVAVLAIGLAVLITARLLLSQKSKRSEWALELNRLHDVNLALLKNAGKRGGIYRNIEQNNESSRTSGVNVCIASATMLGGKLYYLFFPGKSVTQYGQGEIIGASLATYTDNGRLKRIVLLSDGRTTLLDEDEFIHFLEGIMAKANST